jgi:hypothetical protein
MLSARSLAIFSFAACLLWLTPARAEDAATLRQEGADLFKQAQAMLARRDKGAPATFREAAEKLEQAYALEPRGEVRFNAAVAWENAGEEARSADAFEAALALGSLAPDYQKWATERLETLRTRLARIAIERPVGATVSAAHVRDRAIPTALHLSPGSHTLEVRCPDGQRAEEAIDAAAGEARIWAPRCPAAVKKPPPPRARVLKEERDTTNGARETSPTWVLGWVGLAVGTALAGTAIGLGVATLDARDDFQASGNTDADALERGENLRLGANITAFGGAIIGGTGILLLIVSAF